MNKNSVIIFSAIILSLGLVFAGLFSRTKQNPYAYPVVTATGVSELKATPDVAYLNVSVSELAKKSSTALQDANQKTTKIIEILEKEDIKKGNYVASSVDVHPSYIWEDGRRVLEGQRATREIKVTVLKYKEDPLILGRLYDSLSEISDITISRIWFDLRDKSQLEQKARKLAVENAIAKCKNYAEGAGERVSKVVNIADSSSTFRPNYTFARANMAADYAAKEAGVETVIEGAEISVTSCVEVTCTLR